ncbi:hypothetical protein F2Q68_00036055 [Brassica cretica]|uniref:Uncharacterized protein n=1 Tax=Brassica cretica TaxID=69181 RepID=A0A8S9H793_BRACR|nr:hypothetical protein F2Q68_00036055 [Brassica cretica]
MDFVVASDRDFWRWQSPAGTLAEQPQIATMKEKPSHHPKREIRAHQTRFGGTEERSIKYESDPRTVNFISLLPLIQKEPGNGRDIIGKISMPAFHFAFTTSLEMKLLWLSTWCPIGVILVSMDRGHIGIHYDWRDLKVNDQEFRSCFVRAVKVHSAFPQVSSEPVAKFAFTTSLEMKLLWLRKWCPIGVNLVSMDRGHIGLHYDRRDRKVNEFRSCFVRAVKVHSAFPQVSSEPVAKKADHHLEFLSKSYGCFFGTDIYRSDPRTVNFISVLPLIQKEPGNRRDIIGNISILAFQIIYPIVKSTYICVYNQPGDEATLVKKMVSDRSDLGVSRPWRRNSVCRPETSTLGVVYAAAQLSRPVVPRLRGETDEYMIFGRIGATELFIRIFYLGFGEEHVNPHEHSTFPDVACLPKTEKSGNHRLRSMIGEDTIVLGILIGTAKEDNGEDGNFASRGGS